MKINKHKNKRGKSPFLSTRRRFLSFLETLVLFRIIMHYFFLKKEYVVITMVPEFVSLDNISRPLIISRTILDKIVRDHGSFHIENLIIHANDWEYVIRNVHKDPLKINLINIIQGAHHFSTIGANRYNGYYIVTYYETYTDQNLKLKNLLHKKGDALDRTGRAVDPSFATTSE